MELKPYQQLVIDDIARFLEIRQRHPDLHDAYHQFWFGHPRTPLNPYPETKIEPYKDNITGVPHVCVKVPTAGGKTFIACNAIRTIADARPLDLSKTVVWMVPSITILEQTVKNLRNPAHAYRQKINTLFNNRVEVFEKNALLQGTGFNASAVQEQLCVLVLSFDSLRAKNKEDRKVYQENSNLQTFTSAASDDESITLMNVIRSLNPIVIVDESHNAESALSIEMLKDLNPWFILDLTATPRKNSNIISFVDALELKKENMVKLPVVVSNHEDKTEVIAAALQLRKNLEEEAIAEGKSGARKIRPMILFQAQPKTSSDNTTFTKLKETLIKLNIPEEHIKIKTASINELKGIDLMDPDCPVRYIITVNALKEGWDCPFAYVLASLADKSSSVDVQQILGRVLRQPYVMKHESPMMNMSYVLTASAKFQDTLNSIVEGLNQSGFSSQDYKVIEQIAPMENGSKSNFENSETGESEIDIERVLGVNNVAAYDIIQKFQASAIEQSRIFEEIIKKREEEGEVTCPVEIQSLVNTYKMKDIYRQTAEAIQIPQFFLKKEFGEIFGGDEILLNPEALLDNFQLSKADANVEFGGTSAEMYKIDIDGNNREHIPAISKIKGNLRDKMLHYILDPDKKESRIKNFTARLMQQLGNLYPITDGEIKSYLEKVLSNFSDEDFMSLANYELIYAQRIKDKITQLSSQQSEKKFLELLDIEMINLRNHFKFPTQIIPGNVSRKNIEKSLYEKEGYMNDFEESVIMEVASLDNVLFWTKNIERKPFSFKMNGFVNHYPDFIVVTKKGKTVLLETKGDDRDNSDTAAKIRLGRIWEGDKKNFRYFMVFDRRQVDGAYVKDDFLKIIKEL